MNSDNSTVFYFEVKRTEGLKQRIKKKTPLISVSLLIWLWVDRVLKIVNVEVNLTRCVSQKLIMEYKNKTKPDFTIKNSVTQDHRKNFPWLNFYLRFVCFKILGCLVVFFRPPFLLRRGSDTSN